MASSSYELTPEDVHYLRLKATGHLLASMVENDRLETEVCVTSYSSPGKPESFDAFIHIKSRVAPTWIFPFPSAFTATALTTEEFNDHFLPILNGFVDFLTTLNIPFRKEATQ